MALVVAGVTDSAGGSSAPAWDWTADPSKLVDISALPDIGTGDAGADEFAFTNYTNGILTGVLGANAECGFELAQIADSTDFVYAVHMGWSWPQQDPSDGSSDLMVGVVFMKKDGAEWSAAADDYRGVGYRIDGNLSTMTLGQPNSTTSWSAVAAMHNAGTTYHGVYSSFHFVLQRSGTDLIGWAWSNGTMRRIFTNSSLGTGEGRLVVMGRNLDGDATGKAVNLIAARTTGLSVLSTSEAGGRLLVS